MARAGKKKPLSGVQQPEVIADRYQVQSVLGRGGMGVIYQVLEIPTGKQLALKKLLVAGGEKKRRAAAEQFEREFCTLAQLAHPRVVAAYDFGIDNAGPHYTMEMLDGGDLRELSPLPWKRACALLSDICSALSLIHSRRMVHRDLSPRNIRCTRDGLAKLIDFGALAPMGPGGRPIGTPAYTAPEVIDMQYLDGRADLYSLGASLYYALTGRHAYLARDFKQVREVWRTAAQPPSHFVADIPRELDNLVLSLIGLDLTARPVNAGEVMDRLCAIADIELDEQLIVAQAYLSTPTLVGRERHLSQARKGLLRAVGGRGSAMLVQGPAGVGRSRFLDAYVLEAKFAGLVVLRADTRDAHAGEWGVAKAAASRLLDAVPEIALQKAEPNADVLGHLLPELRERFPDIEPERFEQPTPQRHNIQAALRRWFVAVASGQTIVLVVDDLHRIDEPSAALLALLAHEAHGCRLVVTCSVEPGVAAVSADAIRLLAEAGTSIKLKNLSQKHTEALLASVFGEVPNVKLVADRIHTASSGNPATVMRLTQHLVDKALVRYQAGAWSLPKRLEADDLPASVSEALRSRVEALGPEALHLVQAMALCAEQGFSLEECRLLAGTDNMAALTRGLDELTAAEVVSTDGTLYAFEHGGWVSVFESTLTYEQRHAAHLRLAEVYQRRGPDRLQVARHLLYAEQREGSLDFLIEHALDLVDRFKTSLEAYTAYAASLPHDWVHTYESALDTCRMLERPKSDYFTLQSDLVRWGQIGTRVGRTNLDELFERLHRESGLQAYYELSDTIEPQARLSQAIEITQQQYNESPEHERWLPPGPAIERLANLFIYTAPMVTVRLDYPLLCSLPSIKPLVSLTPALEIVDKVLQAVGHTITGRYEKALALYREIIARVEQPDRAGLDDTYYHYTRLAVMYALGQIEAAMGIRSALGWADQIEADPLHQVNAWRIRAVYQLCQGNRDEADACKKRTELLRIQNSPTQYLEGANVITEILSYARTDDLMGIKQLMPEVEAMADRFPAWRPMLHYATGEYQRIRGDYESALAEFEAALEATQPGRHLIWPDAAGAQLGALAALGRCQQAKKLGQQWLQACKTEQLRFEAMYVANPLSMVLAELGEREAAIAMSDDVLERCREFESTGVPLGLFYEARSRIAISLRDQQAFRRYARLCGEQWKEGRNPSLTAKYERLTQAARRAGLLAAGHTDHASESERGTDHRTADLSATMLRSCYGLEDRATGTLALIVERSKALGGFLYLMKADQPQTDKPQTNQPHLVAQQGDCVAFAEMDDLVSDFLAAEMSREDDITITKPDLDTDAKAAARWTGPRGESFLPVVLGHYAKDSYLITGLVVLLVDPDRGATFPADLCRSLSRALSESGDAVKV